MKLARTSIALAALAGALAASPQGFAQDNQEAKSPATNAPVTERRAPQRGVTVEKRLDNLSEHLQLTEQQKSKVKVVLDEQYQEVENILTHEQPERGPKLRAAREAADKKIKEILTPEQAKKYDELQHQRAQRPPAGQTPPAGKPPEKSAEKKDAK